MKWFFPFLSIACGLFGCTDFVVKAADGTYVNGRSLEFGTDLKAKLQIFPNNMKRASTGPKGEKGIQWVSQYGYLGVTVFGLNFSMDGMNEKGLSLGFLWMPGPQTQYQAISAGDQAKALDLIDFGDWILGNFATVAELKEALKGVRVWGHPVPPLPGIPPIHAAIHDASGNHLVVEFIKGEMRVYDNPTSVLTNYPPFDWMLINLQNYVNLNAFNTPSVKLRGSSFGGTGQGTGFLGMPGDWTPPSRFVRMCAYIRFANPAQNSLAAVNLAEHLLNTVDIPLGEIRERTQNGVSEDSTQWTVIKDLTHQVFYFRSYRDLCLKSVDMKQLDFTPGGQQRSIPIEMEGSYKDVTASLIRGTPSTK